MKNVNLISLVTFSAVPMLFMTAALAVEDAGRVMFVAGKATIINAAGKERIASKGDFLQQGDRLLTSDKGVMQVKMRDDGIMAVRPGTDLKLNNMVPQLNKTDRPSQALLLSRGGVRVLTGTDQKKLGYLIKTSATSIGLRDGDTEALVIPVPKAAEHGNGSAPAGTYNRVYAGKGTIQGAADKVLLDLTANQGSYTPSLRETPVLVASLPPSYLGTVVPTQLTDVVRPTSISTSPPPSVPGGIVLAQNIVAPTVVTTIAPDKTLVIASMNPGTKESVLGAATPALTNLAPLPIALAPIAVMAPPPVVIAPPTLVLNPILVMKPIVLPPPPPPVITTVISSPSTPTVVSTKGTVTGTFCIKGVSC